MYCKCTYICVHTYIFTHMCVCVVYTINYTILIHNDIFYAYTYMLIFKLLNKKYALINGTCVGMRLYRYNLAFIQVCSRNTCIGVFYLYILQCLHFSTFYFKNDYNNYSITQ